MSRSDAGVLQVLDALFAAGGWRGWALDAEDRVQAVLGRWRDVSERALRRWRGAPVDAVAGDALTVVQAVLARLEVAPSGRVLAGPGGGYDGLGVRCGDLRAVVVRRTALAGLRARRADLVRGAVAAASGVSSVSEVLVAVARRLRGDLAELVVPLRRRGSEGVEALDRRELPEPLREPFPVGNDVLWRVFESGRPLVVDDLRSDPRLDLDPSGRRLRELPLRSLAVWPLGGDAPAVGALLVGRTDEALTEGDLDILHRVAAAVHAAVDRASIHDRLVAQHDFLQQVLAATSDGVVVSTLSGRVVLWNHRMEEITGRPVEEVERDWVQRVGLRAVDTDSASATSGPNLEGDDYLFTLPDGGERRVIIQRVDLVGPEGEPLVLEFVRDLTEWLRAREAVLRSQNLARLGRLAGGISHQLNNILGAVLGHAEILCDDPAFPPEVGERARDIVRHVQRGSELAQELLAFGMGAPLPPRPVDLGRVVEAEMGTFRKTEAAGPDLAAEGLSDGLLVSGDSTRLRQVVHNLLSNAVEAAGARGRVALSLRPVDGVPEGAWQLEPQEDRGPWVLLQVTDDGPGFPARALRHLFEPFFSTKGWNHGLGLAAVHGIVRSAGGGIRVCNLPAGGARVEVLLPRARPASQAGAGRSARLVEPCQAGGRQVWVVDDERSLLDLMGFVLRRQGFEVRCFGDAESVLAEVDGGLALPDALVLDVILPKRSGPELARALRERCGDMPPVIYVSGYSPRAVDLRVEEPDRFLQKPFSPRELADAVCEALVAAGIVPAERPALG